MPGLEPRAPRFVFCGSNSQRAARGKGRAETLNTRCTYSSTAHIKVIRQPARGERHRPLERTKLWISADQRRPRPESGVGALVWRSRLKDLLRQSSGPRFGHEAVDKQRGQSVDEPPSRHGLRVLLLRSSSMARRDALDIFEGGARSLIQRGILRPLDQDRPEHQAEQSAFLQGEFDIGETQSDQRIRPVHRRLHRRDEFPEALGGNGSKKILLAREMAVSGRRRNPYPARRLA